MAAAAAGDRGFYLGYVPIHALELALRLPPLYLMDDILMREMAVSNALFGMDAAAADASNGSGASATLTSNDGRRVRVTGAPPSANFSEALEAASEAAFAGGAGAARDPWEEVYARLYGGSADAAVLPYYFLNVTLGVLAYAGAAFVLTLNLRHLLVFYAYVTALLCLPFSYLSHSIMIETLSQLAAMDASSVGDPANAEWFVHRLLTSSILTHSLSLETRAVLANYLIQAALALVLSSVLKLHFDDRNALTKVVSVSMLSPNLLAVLGAPQSALEMSAVLSLVVPLGLSAVAFYSVSGSALRSVLQAVRKKRQFVLNFGLNVFLENEWQRIRVPALLRTFWLTRVGLHLLTHLLKLHPIAMPLEVPTWAVVTAACAGLARQLVTRGAETIIAVLGMTSVVSSVCHYVGSFFHMVLSANAAGADEDADEKSVASVSAVLFFVLALQTGLTSLDPDKRFARLCKNLCLLLAALFHFIHNMVSPVLMSLSASHNYNSKKHMRALFICAFLVLAPITLMTYLWETFNVGTWLLAVSAFCVEVIVKVVVTVAVYLLFLYDQYYQNGMWERLDDAVYYVKASGNSVEFCFAVFLFFNGGWILLFESGGTIRAVMMLIHAYCNIWLEAKAGWQTFMKRRTAVAKIDNLPDATEEELRLHNDVCAICYQEMTSTAKVTRCRHYFHGVCLRKWLYVQDSCPLCYGPLHSKGNLNGVPAAADGAGGGEEGGEAGEGGAAEVAGEDELIDNDASSSSSSEGEEEEEVMLEVEVGATVQEPRPVDESDDGEGERDSSFERVEEEMLAAIGAAAAAVAAGRAESSARPRSAEDEDDDYLIYDSAEEEAEEEEAEGAREVEEEDIALEEVADRLLEEDDDGAAEAEAAVR